MTARVSVLADGAAWIWDQARDRLGPHADWCADVYHVAEHLHAAGRAVRGGEGPAARAWAEDRLADLVARAGPKFLDRLDAEIAAAAAAAADPAHVGALTSLRTYLAGNRDRMWYADRLRAGRPIGSGAVEGACKKVGARLKLNAARWRVRRVERFGALLCLDYAGQTDEYWRSRAA